jgi:hypothetical protein
MEMRKMRMREHGSTPANVMGKLVFGGHDGKRDDDDAE